MWYTMLTFSFPNILFSIVCLFFKCVYFLVYLWLSHLQILPQLCKYLLNRVTHISTPLISSFWRSLSWKLLIPFNLDWLLSKLSSWDLPLPSSWEFPELPPGWIFCFTDPMSSSFWFTPLFSEEQFGSAYMSENIFNLPSHLPETLSTYKSLDFRLFSFGILKTLFPCILASSETVEKWDAILIPDSLYSIWFFSSYRIFSLSSIFWNFMLTGFGVRIFSFNELDIQWAFPLWNSYPYVLGNLPESFFLLYF